MIELFTSETPNGWKISITLEEMGLPYEYRYIKLSERQQKEDWYLKLNPNGASIATTTRIARRPRFRFRTR